MGTFVSDNIPEPAALAASCGRHLSVHLGRPIHKLKLAQLRSGVGGAQKLIDRLEPRAVIVDREAGFAHRMIAHMERRYETLEDFPRFVVFRTDLEKEQ